jgi:2-polyprenyl-6-methoxyphenol hydroxylase-like FAD-dependent oxidoreductase
VLGNRSDLLERLPSSIKPVGKPIWRSNFHISHRLIQQLNVRRIFFGGDAAHIHSPLGARGMNLGIEDSFVFAELLASKKLDHYSPQRADVHRKLVKRIERMTNIARGETSFARFLRLHLLPRALAFPLSGPLLFKMLTGLDHETFTQGFRP